APAGVQLGEAHIAEINVGCLRAAPPRISWVLVSMPGIVRPIAPALRLIRTDLPDPGVQERVDSAVHPRVPHLAEDPEDGHPRAMLEAPGPGPLHHLDHLWRIPLLPQPPRARF